MPGLLALSCRRAVQGPAYVPSGSRALASPAGTRRNDISQQMRNIARQMTAEEIDQVARYYEAQP